MSKNRLNKTFATTIITLLMLSIILVATPIQPVSSAGGKVVTYYPTLEATAKAKAEWATDPEDPETATRGYNAKLTLLAGADWTNYSYVRVYPKLETAITLDTIDITTLTFEYWVVSGARYPDTELTFKDPDSDGYVEISLYQAGWTSNAAWQTGSDWTTAKTVAYGKNSTGASIALDEIDRTLTEMITAIKALDSTASGWELTTITPQNGWGLPSGVVYVDNVEIDSVTIEDFEPRITLDYACYKMDDVVKVTVFDIGLNKRPAVKDTGYFIASSDYPDQITVTLTETGLSTAVFEGTFSLVETDPGANDLLVKDGSEIFASYDRSGAIEEAVDSATVDGVKPTSSFTEPSADNTAHAGETYEISGTASDVAGSGVYLVEVSTDNQLTWKKAEGTDSWSYEWTLPEDGNYTVWCRATDVAGNVETPTELRFIIVDNTGPDVTDAKAKPSKAIAEGETVLTAKVTEQWTVTSVSSVTINLTSIGLGTQEMNYDAEDGIYTYTATVGAEVADGIYYLNITATDNLENENTTEYILFEVVTDEIPPVIESWLVEYPMGKETGRVDDEINITVIVTDLPAGVNTVAINGSDITGDPDFEQMVHIETTDAWNIILTVVDVEDGTKYLNVTATDYAGNKVSVLVEVEIVKAQRAIEISLAKGWNLISLPLIPNNSTIEAVLEYAMADTNVVWSYNAETGKWFMYSPAAPEISDLTSMVDGKGYWVKTTTASVLIAQGVELPLPPVTPPRYKVVLGWNLIGFKEIEGMEAIDYLAGIEGKYVTIYTYQAGQFVRIDPIEDMETGSGYWIAVTEEGYIYP